MFVLNWYTISIFLLPDCFDGVFFFFFFPSFPKAEICPDSLLLVLSLWMRDYGGVHEAIWDILLLPPHS